MSRPEPALIPAIHHRWNMSLVHVYIPADTNTVSQPQEHATMAKRSRMTPKQNRSNFSRGNRVNPKNVPSGTPMRGGIRL